MCLALSPVLQSCDDDDSYSIGDFTPPLWATVRVGGGAFYLDCDVWGTLWPVNTDLGWYTPVDGQRVITYFNPLWDDFEGYDHAVKILGIQNVLTKQVETLTPETDEDFGNDPVTIYQGDITISGGYMNIIFVQNLPAKEKHRISLVRPQDDAELYGDDGYVHLELRYNDYDDVTGYGAWGIVSQPEQPEHHRRHEGHQAEAQFVGQRRGGSGVRLCFVGQQRPCFEQAEAEHRPLAGTVEIMSF